VKLMSFVISVDVSHGLEAMGHVPSVQASDGTDEDSRVLVAELPGATVEVDAAGAVYIAGDRVTDGSGWLVVATTDDRVEPTLREIHVHLVADARARADGMQQSTLWIDRVRLAGIEWRSVREFLAATIEQWAPVIVTEAKRALGGPKASGMRTRK
jgi:hypothetical protein